MLHLQKTREVLDGLDASRSSSTSLDHTLSTLSPEDIEVIDAIISRVPTATAFMTVFKAYTEVLRERGLDPGNDVVYYKQLLKLGVIRGVDWGEKWLSVKSQLGYVQPKRVTSKEPTRTASSTKLPRFEEDDVFTSPSRFDETETVVDPGNIILDNSSDIRRSAQPPVRQNRPLMRAVSPTKRQRTTPSMPRIRSVSPHPSVCDEGGIPPLRPQSSQWHRYRINPNLREKGKEIPSNVRGKTSSHLNDKDAWRNIERSRHVEDADRFRRESLLTTCFHVWKVGLEWIHSTHAQIDDARNQVQLQVYFARWKARVVRAQRVAKEAVMMREIRLRQAAFQRWKVKAGQQVTKRWKEKMRINITHFRRREEARICNEAWTRWRQLYISRQVYVRNTLYKAVRRWRTQLKAVDELEALAYDFEDARMLRMVGNAFETWCRCVQLRDAERYLLSQKSKSTLGKTLAIWAQKLRDNRKAAALRAKFLVKQTFITWRKVLKSKELLVTRSDKYIKRRHHLLIWAVIRVWVARERGKLLERVRATRLMRSVWSIWCQKIAEHDRSRSQAISFSQHYATRTLVSAMSVWNLRIKQVANQERLAKDWYTSVLLYQTLLIWRLQLRARFKTLRKTIIARRLFMERDVWNKWRSALAKKRLDRTAQILAKENLRQIFTSWLRKLQRKRYEKQVIELFKTRSQKYLLQRSMQQWMNKIVFVRLRALDTIEQSDRDCLSRAFAKWRWVVSQHVENLSLLDSFRVVKREDIMRRVFMKWYALARKARIRAALLAAREDELRKEILTVTWEIWRDRFRELGLQDLEYQVIIQNQRSTLHHALMTWRSRSKSVPAIRQYANNLKFKMWQTWRKTLPLAKQTRLARATYTKKLLSMIFTKWKHVHRTKVALKAVARARHLRLPGPGYKPSNNIPKSKEPQNPRLALHRSPYIQRSNEDEDPVPTPRASFLLSGQEAINRRRRLSSLLSAPPIPKADTTPHSRQDVGEGTQSVTSTNRRNKLWNELRGARVHNDHERASSR